MAERYAATAAVAVVVYEGTAAAGIFDVWAIIADRAQAPRGAAARTRHARWSTRGRR